MMEIARNVLKNAPLKEVIFELHWELDFIPEQKAHTDLGFDEAVLNFKSASQQDFKYFKLIAPSAIPAQFLINRVTHRFFNEKDKHPLFQLGPGVFTVNDNNKNYTWNEFENLILKGTEYLKNSYEKDLIISKLELRYIDAVNCNVLGEKKKIDFVRENFHVNPDPYPFVNGDLIDINFSKRFLIENDSYLNITVATGRDESNNEDLIIWHTYINNKERVTWSDLPQWIKAAHSVCSDTFKKMISNKLYEYFS